MSLCGCAISFLLPSPSFPCHPPRSMLGSFMNSTTYTGLTYILFIVVMVMMDRLHKFGKQAPGRTLSVTIEVSPRPPGT